MSHNAKRISTRKRTAFGGSGEARTDREDQEEYEEQEEGRQNCSACAPQFFQSRPSFFALPLPTKKSLSPKQRKKTSATRPSQTVTFTCKIKRREERGVLCPPQSRLTFEISVLWYRNSGGQYHPPLSRTTPLTKKSGWLRSLRFATVAKPSWCAKGGGAPHFPQEMG